MKRFILLLSAVIAVASCSLQKAVNTVSDEQLSETYSELRQIYETDLSKKVIMPGEGYLKYPYMIPAGFYKQMWDWDGFFMGTYFCKKGRPEYLRYWAMNLMEGVDERGYVAGCATTKGPRPIFGDFAMKPFLSQGVLISSKASCDFEWVRPYYDKLKMVLSYREKSQQDSLSGLFFWQIAMQSGADNNPALNYWKDDTRSYLACDASAWQLREYRAQAQIAKALGFEEDAQLYEDKSASLAKAIIEYLWCDEDGVFYNVDRETRTYYKRISYSTFVPLVADVLTKDQAARIIDGYLLNPDYMRSDYGLTSLSRQDPEYNNRNIIKPFSNWQGPVWPVANFIYSVGLKKYGYDEAVRWIAYTLGQKLIADYKEYGSLHECYDAESGKALSPDDSHVDENGRFVGFVSWNLCIENILAGCVEDDWNLLEL